MAAAAAWLAAAAMSPGDARRRLVRVAWFGIAVAPFVSSPVIWGGFDINALPISALTSFSLLLVASLALTAQNRHRFPARLRPIAAASIGMWVTMVLCNLIAGAPTELRAISGGLALIVVFLTLDDSRWPLTGLRSGLLVLTVMSFLFSFIRPNAWMADVQRFPLPISTPYPGRLIGISFSPNHLGYIVGLLILLQILGPKSRLPTIPVVTLAGLVLLLTGSRSAVLGLGAAALAAMLLQRRRSGAWYIGAAAAAGGVWLLVSQSLTKTGDVSTFNGRTVIWDAVFSSFSSHPWFGIGPGGWEHLVSFYHLPAYAVEGHNQVIDTLGKQGIFGLIALGVWLAVAITTIVRLESHARVLPGALLGFMIGRSIFEVPLDVYFIGPGTISVAAFAAAAAWKPERVIVSSLLAPRPMRAAPRQRTVRQAGP